MARKPQKRAPARRGPVEPRDTSRGAGAPAPASAAATEAFYSPGGASPSPGDLSAAVDPRMAHAANVARESVGTDGPHTADATLALTGNSPRQDLASEIARIRSIRKPLGAYAQKLALDARPGYHRHWFNDMGNRVSEALNNGWAHVLDEEKRSIRRAVGTGRDNGVQYAYAMEIPEVFWQEDMAARHEVAQEKIEALKKSPVRAEKGQSQRSDQGKFYSPQEDILSVEKG